MNKPEHIRAYLIHLGSNMWKKKDCVPTHIRHEEDAGATYHRTMACQKDVWKKVTDFLPSCGINTLVIDMGEGVRLDSHPELAIPGSWSKEEFREELARLRAIGLTPIPKFNFSCGHNAWMQDYAYMVGTKTYYDVCRDVIEETIELFDTPAYFHLGLEEEDYGSQKTNYIAVVRTPAKKTEDALYLFDICRAHGVRPWIWADFESFGGPEEFAKKVGKDVLISTWYYGMIRDGTPREALHSAVKMINTAADLGYDVIPTSSTWSWHLNSKDTMMYCRDHADMSRIAGFMTASWLLTIEKKYYALLNDAYTFYHAYNDIFGSENR